MKSSIYEVEHPRSCERGGSEPFEREKELSCGEVVRERAPTLACARVCAQGSIAWRGERELHERAVAARGQRSGAAYGDEVSVRVCICGCGERKAPGCV